MYSPFIYSTVGTLTLGGLTIATLRWHGAVTNDAGKTVQAIHDSPVPRIGGLPIYLTLCFSFLFIHLFWQRLFLVFGVQLNEIMYLLSGMALAVTPIFFVGFLEDLTKKISPRFRLMISILSGLLGCIFLKTRITMLGFDFLDLVMSWPILSLIFTAFATAGVANAFNIIDGLNGLALFLSLQVLAGLGLLSYSHDDSLMLMLCILVAGSASGLLILNWPFGKIFLGDGGAYLLGFLIAWSCVLLNERHEIISPYAFLLLCAYPVVEVIFSSWRRLKRSQSSSHADSFHLHQLIYRQVICKRLKGCSLTIKNSAAGLLCASFALPTTILAVEFSENQAALLLFFTIFVVLYIVGYRFLADAEEKSRANSPSLGLHKSQF